MVAQSQKDHRTKIKTVLDKNPQFKKKPDEDPLCLVMVQGSEAVSAPYYMDVVMIADRGVEIDPKLMINTPATVYIRVEDRAGLHNQFNFTYQQRKGVFQTFIKQDRFHRRIGHDYNMYAGRIVPGFQIMDQEVRYRIFEKSEMNFLSVLKDCTETFKPLPLASGYMDTSRLTPDGPDGLPKMEHCVQYGESTFNFLSRLMNRFSLWYYFDHGGDGDLEKMVIGTGHIAMGSRDPKDRSDKSFPRCDIFETFPDRRDIEKDLIVQDWQFVNGVSRVYTPAPRRTRTSDFNTVISTQPIQSEDNNDTQITKDFDIINPSESVPISNLHGSTESNYIQESFPDSTIYKDGDATNDATTALEIAEGQVFALSGVSKNTTFYAGKRFLYQGLKEDNRFHTEQLIVRMSFNAYDRDYMNIITREAAFGFAALLDDLFVQPATSFATQFGSNTSPDFATAMAAAGLQEAINNLRENAWVTANSTAAQKASQDALAPSIGFGTYFAAGMAGYASAFLPNATSILQDLLSLFQGTVDVLSVAVETLVKGVLVIPIIFAKLAGHDLAGDIHRQFVKTTDKIDLFLKRLLYVPTVDAFSACFVSEPLEKGLIGPPLPTARNAQIFGPHLATVIGKNGIDLAPGNIWADKLGRVRVRFPWDRTPLGAEVPFNRESSEWTDAMAKPQYLVGTDTAWLRVSDAWAGLRQFGTQFLPRVGDEVVVSFIDSDPDRPIITGRVYNSYNRDANHPFPPQGDTTSIDDMQSLRKLQGTKDWNYSGIKTRSMPLKATEKDRFHLLRFDDTKDKEQYLIRSQRRLDITALERRYESISSDRHLTVGGVDPKTHTVAGNYFAKAFKDYNLHVGDPSAPFLSGNRKTKLEAAESLAVGQNSDESIGGNWSVSVGGGPTGGGQVSISALLGTGIISLSSLTNITLMCTPASSIVITPAAISIMAPKINLIGQVSGPVPVPIPPPVPLPPAPAIPAVPQAPTDPTPADPGDKPVPPKE
jgi:uncharacterized protein involved in type VI secretion and phage assembly